MFNGVDSVQEALTGQDYIAERSLATAIYLALQLKKPLFLEGEAGVGKDRPDIAIELDRVGTASIERENRNDEKSNRAWHASMVLGDQRVGLMGPPRMRP